MKNQIILLKWIIYIVLIAITMKCNFQEQCYAQNGNDSLDVCISGLALYNAIPEERRTNSSLDRTILFCLYEYKKIEECKKEPRRWPFQD